VKTYSFEKLECWKSAKDLAVWVYSITNSFPDNERFGLISQMRRASISVASNLAEGTSRISTNDQLRFYTISYSSTIELLNQLIISKDLKLLNDELYLEGRMKIEKQTFLITRLRNSGQQKLKNDQIPSKLI